MDVFELNKIIGALLLSVLLVIAINNLADAVISPKPLAKNVYVVAGVQNQSASATETAVEPATEPSEASESAAPATGTDVAETAAAEATEATEVAATTPDFATLVAAASPEAGARLFRRCAACHTASKDGKFRDGPNLQGVVGRPVASEKEYKYSSALAGHGGVWDEPTLNLWLTSPRGLVPGTKMTFAGIKNESDRANLVAYLKTLHD